MRDRCHVRERLVDWTDAEGADVEWAGQKAKTRNRTPTGGWAQHGEAEMAAPAGGSENP